MATKVEEIRRLKFARPFVPFRIRTSAGKEYPVPTMANVGTLPGQTRIVVFDEDDTFDIVKETSIDGIELSGSGASS